jgi:pilus assembly protein Flp/PilA
LYEHLLEAKETSVQRPSTKTIVRNQHGAALVEYALLLAVIAVVCIVALTSLGNDTSSQFDEPEAASAATTSSQVTVTNYNTPPTTTTASPVSLSLECARVYRDKALAALRQAEEEASSESVYRHLELASTYLNFAREADNHQPQSCLSGS